MSIALYVKQVKKKLNLDEILKQCALFNSGLPLLTGQKVRKAAKTFLTFIRKLLGCK